MNQRANSISPARVIVAIGLLMVGFALGRASGGISSAQAENGNAMHVVVGTPGSPACTPAATPVATATPTPVPPVAAGQPVPYGDDWTVTVNDVSLMPTFGNATAEGTYAKVSITAVNNTESLQRFPYEELVLRDAQNRVFLTSLIANSQDIGNWYFRFSPSVPTAGFVVFDAPADARGPFILESTTDPAFRALIDIEVRG